MSVLKASPRSCWRVNGESLAALAVLGWLTGFLAGCGGGGGGGAGSGPPDTTSPTVTGMSPGEDTAVLGINSRLTATLSEAMVPGAINTDNFRLTDGISAIPGVVTYDVANHVAAFTPAVDLAPNTRYTATIVTGIQDLAGNPLTTDFAWCFVTAGTADSTTPVVTATFPVNGAGNVPVNQAVSATFSTDMDTATITPVSFTLSDSSSAPVLGTVTYRGRTAVFRPRRALAANTAYTATLAADILDLAGNATQATVTWSFSTGGNADGMAPVVLSTSPANGAADVPIGSTISAALSESLDPASLTTESFTVTGPGGATVIGIVAFDPLSNTATFTRTNHLTTPVVFHPTPVSDLEANTTYTATLNTGARDLAGNALGNDLVWSFTTAP